MTDDLPAVIRKFGQQEKIFFVHLRDVRGTAEDFVENPGLAVVGLLIWIGADAVFLRGDCWESRERFSRRGPVWKLICCGRALSGHR